MTNEYIDFEVSPYALADVLLALHNSKIYEVCVTKEDGNIHIRIDKRILEKNYYINKLESLPEVTVLERAQNLKEELNKPGNIKVCK